MQRREVMAMGESGENITWIDNDVMGQNKLWDAITKGAFLLIPLFFGILFFLEFQSEGSMLALGLAFFFFAVFILDNFLIYYNQHYRVAQRVGICAEGLLTECGKERYNRRIPWNTIFNISKDSTPINAYILSYSIGGKKSRTHIVVVTPEIYRRIAAFIPNVAREVSGEL